MPDLYNELDNPPVTDWNVTLGITKPDVPPPVDQYGGLRLSRWTDIPIEEAQSFLRMAEVERQRQDEARSAAIRYQGQVDFQRLIDSGVSADQAMRQAGPKMFYKHPQALAAAIPHMQASQATEPEEVTLDDGTTVIRWLDRKGQPHILKTPTSTGTRATALKPPPLTEEQKMELSFAKTELGNLNGAMIAAEVASDKTTADKLKTQYEAKKDEIRQLLKPPPITYPFTTGVHGYEPEPAAPPVPTTAPPPVLDTMRQQLQETGVSPGAANMPAPEPPNYVPETPPVAAPAPDLAPRTPQAIADRRMSILTNPPPAQTAPAGVPLLNAPVQPPPAAAEPQGAASKPVRIRRKSDGKVFIYRGRAADVPKDQYEIL